MELFICFGLLLFAICFVGFLSSVNTVNVMKLIQIREKVDNARYESITKHLEVIDKKLDIIIKKD